MSILLEQTAKGEHFEPPEDTTVTFTEKIDPYDLPWGPLRKKALQPPLSIQYSVKENG
jgi:hypothetical protein